MNDVNLVTNIILKKLNESYNKGEKCVTIIGTEIYKEYEYKYGAKNMAPTVCQAMRKICNMVENPYKYHCIIRNTPSTNSSQYRIEFFVNTNDYWQTLSSFNPGLTINDWYDKIKYHEATADFIKRLIRIRNMKFVTDDICDEIASADYYDWSEKTFHKKIINKDLDITSLNYNIYMFEVKQNANGKHIWKIREELIEAVNTYINKTYTKQWFIDKAINMSQIDKESVSTYEYFNNNYSSKILQQYSGEKLLNKMFLGTGNNDNLAHFLEYSSKTTNFGSIKSGTSNTKYPMFCKNGKWIKNNKEISLQDAIQYAENIRNDITKIISQIEIMELKTKSDYELLGEKLANDFSFKANKIWFLKFLHLSFPSKFPTYYTESYQKFILHDCLNINPEEKAFSRLYQLNAISKEYGISNRIFDQIMYDTFGGKNEKIKDYKKIKKETIYKLYVDFKDENNTNLFEQNYIYLDWNNLCDLNEFIINDDNYDIKAIQEELNIKYPVKLKNNTIDRVNQIIDFASLSTGYLVVIVNGNKFYGIARLTGEYFYDEYDTKHRHKREVDWLYIFDQPHQFITNEQVDIKFKLLVKRKNIDFLLNLLNSRMINNLGLEEQYIDKKINKTEEESMSTLDLSKNTILFGPPGTGKTYNTVIYAVAIVENERVDKIKEEAEENYQAVLERYNNYKKENLIDFVTFHQSYGYEEFIEGIKPIVDEDKDTIKYNIQNGIFKDFCGKAQSKKIVQNNIDMGLNESPTIWKVSLEHTGDNPTRTYCMKNNCIRVGYDEYGENLEEVNDYLHGGKSILDAFYNKMQIGDIVLSCYSNTTTDAIGVITGDVEWHDEFKNLKRFRKVDWLVKDIKEDVLAINKGKYMMQGAVYKLDINLDDILNIVKENNKNNITVEKNKNNYVFIIDEINRGNISKIFGELITLIEDTKRKGAKEEMSITLPYSKKQFSVPNNVYILGTMNTADRSIAHIDTALRRRFDFKEMMPDASLLKGIMVGKINIEKALNMINDRISVLYDREHTIGHAYFMDLIDNPKMEILSNIFKNKVIPLLQEYFFDDYEKIRLVLGDNYKLEENQFINKTENIPSNLFFGNTDIEIEDSFTYLINSEAFEKEKSYIGIYEGLGD